MHGVGLNSKTLKRHPKVTVNKKSLATHLFYHQGLNQHIEYEEYKKLWHSGFSSQPQEEITNTDSLTLKKTNKSVSLFFFQFARDGPDPKDYSPLWKAKSSAKKDNTEFLLS